MGHIQIYLECPIPLLRKDSYVLDVAVAGTATVRYLGAS